MAEDPRIPQLRAYAAWATRRAAYPHPDDIASPVELTLFAASCRARIIEIRQGRAR